MCYYYWIGRQRVLTGVGPATDTIGRIEKRQDLTQAGQLEKEEIANLG